MPAARPPSISPASPGTSRSCSANVRWRRPCRITWSAKSPTQPTFQSPRESRSSTAPGARVLDGLVLEDCDDKSRTTVDADALFILIGSDPQTDWLSAGVVRDPKGFILTGADLPGTRFQGSDDHMAPLMFETICPECSRTPSPGRPLRDTSRD